LKLEWNDPKIQIIFYFKKIVGVQVQIEWVHETIANSLLDFRRKTLFYAWVFFGWGANGKTVR